MPGSGVKEPGAGRGSSTVANYWPELAAPHHGGIVHRDLKPNNVMLESSGPRLNVSIMDFGLARLHQAENTLFGSGIIAGMPGYMAPELLRGERPTKATDLFALGVVLHQVLTGERPTASDRGIMTVSPSLRSVHASATLVQAVESFPVAGPRNSIPRLRACAARSDGDAGNSDPCALCFAGWKRLLVDGRGRGCHRNRGHRRVADAAARFRATRFNPDHRLVGTENGPTVH